MIFNIYYVNFPKVYEIKMMTPTLTFEDIVRIAKVYGLKAHEILNPKLTFPNIEKLPDAIPRKKLLQTNPVP